MGRITVIFLCAVLALVVAASPSPDDLAEKLILPIPLIFRPHVDDLLRSEPGVFMLQHGRHMLYTIIGLLALHQIYQLLFKPFYLVRSLEERGYVNFERQGTMRQVAETVMRRRMRGDLPPVYPNGWFRVCDSSDIKVGQVRSVTILGEALAVFRGENGIVYVVNAYCPHNGANLGIGGRVIGNCVECPFHGWRFRGDDGKCTRIPYAEKVPDFAKTKVWLAEEFNQIVYVWYHAEGAEPDWTPEIVEGVHTGRWKYGGMTEHLICAHIEEVPENGADVPHLDHLHAPFLAKGVDLRFTKTPGWGSVQHKWTAKWEQQEAPNGHVGVLQLSHALEIFNRVVPGTLINVQARQIGPSIVHLFFNHSIFGEGVLMQQVTPVEPLLQRMTHQVYGEPRMPLFIPKIFIWGEYQQVERDMMIWNNKRYVSRPLLIKEDELVRKHRRWYSQFYSKNSPRYNAQRTSLDW